MFQAWLGFWGLVSGGGGFGGVAGRELENTEISSAPNVLKTAIFTLEMSDFAASVARGPF